MTGFAQYLVSHAEPSLTKEERAPFQELADDAYVEMRACADRILCRGIVKVETDWQSILEHLTAINRDPNVLAVPEMDGRFRGTEWEYQEEGSRRLVGEPLFPVDHGAYAAFFTAYEMVDEAGHTVTVTPPQNSGSGWDLPLWDEPIYPFAQTGEPE